MTLPTTTPPPTTPHTPPGVINPQPTNPGSLNSQSPTGFKINNWTVCIIGSGLLAIAGIILLKLACPTLKTFLKITSKDKLEGYYQTWGMLGIGWTAGFGCGGMAYGLVRKIKSFFD
jgi:hypothetical protein